MLRFAVWFVAGCTCPSFADMVVTDPDDLTDDTFEAEIADRIATFAAWTGRDGVCVPEVRTLHELCHALDGVEGHSTANPVVT